MRADPAPAPVAGVPMRQIGAFAMCRCGGEPDGWIALAWVVRVAVRKAVGSHWANQVLRSAQARNTMA
ncbi:MAG: hypothetical protein ACOH1P_06085 [Lysobacter sp.]